MDGLRVIAYLVTSQTPMLKGMDVLLSEPIPAWNSQYASEANMFIIKMIENKVERKG